jgi:excinuclease ABC subunit A
MRKPGTRPPRPRPAESFVRARGAREHNLKDVDVDIPRDALVVFTGVSGSGKSSLAFGTLYAEAQRRYFESVAPYARRLIDQVGVPAVDSIEGLPPAVALQQQRGTPSTRSSVGSVSTLSSLVRLLYSRTGRYPAGQPMLYAEDFSPNTPQGACPACHGLGHVFEVTERSMVPDDTLTIRERAIAAWPPAWHGQNLRDILVTLGHDVDVPWRDLPRKARDWILFTDEQPTVPVYAGFTPAETRAALRRKAEPSYQGTFTGVRKYVLQTFATTQSASMKKRVSRFMTGSPCPACHGKRLKPEALSVTFAGVDIAEMSRLPLHRLADLLAPAAEGQGGGGPDDAAGLPGREASRRVTARRVAAGGSAHASAPDVRRTPHLSEEKRLAHDLRGRIATLQSLGLGYLSLDRGTPTLSPGELQRLRLATQIRSNLFGVVYVLDEPTAGLHPVDGEALLQALDALKRSGNTLFVVEHDLETMRRADWLVDVGPEAGERGGRVLYSGPPAGLRGIAASGTARYLFAEGTPPAALRVPRSPAAWLTLRGVTRNNLDGIDARFPLGLFTAVTGVSGSGKSSLVSQALVELVGRQLGPGGPAAAEADDPEEPALPAPGEAPTGGSLHGGLQGLRRLVPVDQKPIGRTPRSNLATYTGLFDPVRKLFAATKAARARGFDAGRFSFNLPKGRCETCEGGAPSAWSCSSCRACMRRARAATARATTTPPSR